MAQSPKTEREWLDFRAARIEEIEKRLESMMEQVKFACTLESRLKTVENVVPTLYRDVKRLRKKIEPEDSTPDA